ncbi:Methyltransferase domain-containing protein [Ruaniaceae bacterium KH17]|nr:Methyltransferase domain-containing protein [Ruaniaceae bacterium KH17]
MRYILFPGRHHLVTRFQVARLQQLLAAHPGAEVIWAITSANHGGTQRNPIPGTRRLGLIEAVAAVEELPSRTFLIANRQPKPDFAHYVIEEIRTQSGGAVTMTPTTTIVACSTPAVIADYERLGYTIDTFELGATPDGEDLPRPWDLVERVIAVGLEDPSVIQAIHPAALAHYRRYGLAETIRQVYADPLIDSDDGDITITRDYASYRAAFEDNAWRKVGEFAHLVRPGRIVDVGCATGQTIKLLSERPALFESDFYGVEVARPLYEICLQRAAIGEFGDANVFFHQRNIMQTTLFEPNSLDTVITMALTHEIYSYLGPVALEEFCERVFTMLRPGGVWINFDVVGPDGGDEPVLVRFRSDDGAPGGPTPDDRSAQLAGRSGSHVAQLSASELGGLSSAARFRQFAQDFRREEGDQISYREVAVGGEEYVELRRADLYEFLSKKDYLNSWYSEAHERFCFFSPADWVARLEGAGFVVTPDARPIQNPWLIANRFAPAAEVFLSDGAPDPWSWTNVLLVAEKPTV